MVSEPPSYGHGFLSLRYIAAFIFFDFLLLPSKLFGIVKPPLEVASTL